VGSQTPTFFSIMMTLNAFKKVMGVENLQFMKSDRTGQQFMTIGNDKIFVSKKLDKTKAIFVIKNDGVQVPELKGTYWLCNGAVSLGDLL
jgi:hypothetical protein